MKFTFVPLAFLRAAQVVPLLAACAAQAEDWPQFRGPNRDGVWNETGLLKTFPAGGLKIRWRVPVGAGLSSPIVSGGRVFLCDSEIKKPKARERVHCFDEKSGKTLWSHSDEVDYPDWAFDPKNPAGPDATPIVAGGKVFALGKNAHLVCLDVRDGAVLWERDLMKDYGLAEFSGSTPSPLIEDRLLILVGGGKPDACVIALDKDSGKEVWRALGDKWTYSSPIVISAGGKRQLIVWTPAAITSLDPATGKIWWREKRDSQGDYTAASPVFHDGLLLAGFVMFRLGADKPDATVLWPEANTSFTRRILSQTSIPLIRDGRVFSDKSYGHLVCLDARTGKLVWQNEEVTDKKNGATQQLFPNGDSVLIFTNEGNLIRARLNADGYKEISRVRLIEPTSPFAGRNLVWPLPAFANQHVFARNGEELICASLAEKDSHAK
ncbi:MAG: PQQ-binding-like beta-propeller repeat protein [Verrucomicrobia bacterium]|nr:PQQ-binding-like beta-propeller repeat protein [Verrucomicrobiota bacterium]